MTCTLRLWLRLDGVRSPAKAAQTESYRSPRFPLGPDSNSLWMDTFHVLHRAWKWLFITCCLNWTMTWVSARSCFFKTKTHFSSQHHSVLNGAGCLVQQYFEGSIPRISAAYLEKCSSKELRLVRVSEMFKNIQKLCPVKRATLNLIL